MIGRRLFLASVGGLPFASAAMADMSIGPLDLSSYKGKVVYVDFWASWCGPCKLSFPYMQVLAGEYHRDDFALVAVNLDSDRQKADAFLQQVGGGVPVVYDPKGVVASKFGVKEMPTSFLLSRSGQVRFVHKGFFSSKQDEYDRQISQLISERA